MSSNMLCKTVFQYNKDPIPVEDMKKLQELSNDYIRVKNYVYQRYGNINSLSKIYPGYTVQNEMTESGFRTQIGMPSVYFYLAIFDALGNIKNQWTHTKKKIMININNQEAFTLEEKHYLRFVLKVNNCLAEVLQNQKPDLQQEIAKQYEKVSSEVNVHKMNQFLRRQIRKHQKKIHTQKENGFSIAERAYRYGDHGIYISVKEKRKRIFIKLTDSNQYMRQLYIRIYPERNDIEILAPIDIPVKQNNNDFKQMGIALGLQIMFTTDLGHEYGTLYKKLHDERLEWIRANNRRYSRERMNNPGRKKYYAKRDKLNATLHTYVNQELNRMLKIEKPTVIYLPKLPANSSNGAIKRMNQSMNLWQRGYILDRLRLKCREQNIELIEVFAKDISADCSSCGAIGTKKEGIFFCSSCGLTMAEKINTAKNVIERGNVFEPHSI